MVFLFFFFTAAAAIVVIAVPRPTERQKTPNDQNSACEQNNNNNNNAVNNTFRRRRQILRIALTGAKRYMTHTSHRRHSASNTFQCIDLKPTQCRVPVSRKERNGMNESMGKTCTRAHT